MSWIRTIPESEATGVLKNVYDAHQKARGWVSNIIKSFSIRPEILRHFQGLFATLMFGPGGLSRVQREMIAVVVSVTNRCHY